MTKKNKNLLAKLLLLTLFILLIQVNIGGITRLTGSGLSITKWEVVTGTLPPMGEVAWQTEFEAYQQIPQYKLLNKDMTLSEFKFIYFWEWLHRLWGRLGFLFILAIFAFFGFTKRLNKRQTLLFGGLLFLYFCQGLMGWFMVASGLSELVYVSHYRLAAHLLLALALFAYIVWWIADLLIENKDKIFSPSMRRWGMLVISVVLLQIVFGAFMSGLRAAVYYPSFPDMNGQMIPETLFAMKPWIKNFGENVATIQFMHRGIAYLLVILVLAYWWKIKGISSNALFKYACKLLPIVLLIQVGLGIWTVIASKQGVPVSLGILHQAVGLLLFCTVWFLAQIIRTKQAL